MGQTLTRTLILTPDRHPHLQLDITLNLLYLHGLACFVPCRQAYHKGSVG